MIKYINILFFLSFFFLISDCKKESPIVPPTPPITEADTTGHDFKWQIDTIGTFQSSLTDVWGSDSNNVYVVGNIYWSGLISSANIIRWNGLNWQPINYSQGYLNSIYGFGKDDIWAVGSWQLDDSLYALITHWDGIKWNTWKFQDYSDLRSIWGTSQNNLYAVGRNGLILHYNGEQWSKMKSNTTKFFTKIWGVDNSEIYVVGYSQIDFSGIVMKYNGVEWVKLLEKSFQNNILSGEISGLWAEKSKSFFISQYVGYDSTWGFFGWPYDNTFIDDIYGSNEKNVFAVGSFYMILHYNGRSFKRYDQFYTKPDGGRLLGVFAKEKNVFIVGRSENARGIVFRGIQ